MRSPRLYGIYSFNKSEVVDPFYPDPYICSLSSNPSNSEHRYLSLSSVSQMKYSTILCLCISYPCLIIATPFTNPNSNISPSLYIHAQRPTTAILSRRSNQKDLAWGSKGQRGSKARPPNLGVGIRERAGDHGNLASLRLQAIANAANAQVRHEASCGDGQGGSHLERTEREASRGNRIEGVRPMQPGAAATVGSDGVNGGQRSALQDIADSANALVRANAGAYGRTEPQQKKE